MSAVIAVKFYVALNLRPLPAFVACNALHAQEEPGSCSHSLLNPTCSIDVFIKAFAVADIGWQTKTAPADMKYQPCFESE